MDWTAPVDIYCERTDAAFWSEPVNAVSNAAFLIAGLWALSRGRHDGAVLVTASCAMLIGIGSFLFHTVAQRWAGVADVAPILLFVLSYLAIAYRRFFGLRWIWAIPAMVATIGLGGYVTSLLAPVIGDRLNGSEGYFPALFALLGCGGALAWRRHRAGGAILGAAAVFTLSLSFRALDPVACSIWATGTHFLWHLLNGTVLAILLYALIRHGAPRPLAGGHRGG